MVRCGLLALMLVLMIAGAWTAPVNVEITGDPPYGYALLRAVRLAFASAPDTPHKPLKLYVPVAPSPLFTIHAEMAGGLTPQLLPITVHHSDPRADVEGVMLVSNSPERLDGPRTLFEGVVESGVPARLLFHHLNDTRERLGLSVELINPHDVPVRAQVIEAMAGPSDDEMKVGHQAALAYAQRESRNAGYIITVPPSSAVSPCHAVVPPGFTISGLARLHILTPGQSLLLRVRAHSPSTLYTRAPMREYIPTAVLGDYHYPTARITYRGVYTVGGNWLFLQLGGLSIPAQRPAQPLHGSYGVWHEYHLTAVNPTPKTAAVQLVVEGAAGGVRLIYTLGGRWQETGILRPGNDVVLATLAVPPGQQRTLTLTAMPQSGSNYPILFTLRARR
jgi:hypothetical protein